MHLQSRAGVILWSKKRSKAQSGAPFIANDTALGDNKIWLLTGPNMAGKSTF